MRASTLGPGGLAVCLMLLAALLGMSPLTPDPARACSPGPGYDPRAESDVIIEGRVQRWTPSLGTTGMFTHVVIDVSVIRVLQGSTPNGTISFVDRASYVAERDSWEPGGSCGSFNEDPEGAFLVIGLTKGADGLWHSSRLRIFFIGEGPSGPDYEAAIRRFTATETPGPPRSGTGLTSDQGNALNSASAGVGWLAVSVGALLLLVSTLGLAATRPRKRL